MIELYILLGLAGIGYVVGTSAGGGAATALPARVPPQLPPYPSAQTVYQSDQSVQAEAETRRRAALAYAKSLAPGPGGGVIGRSFRDQPERNTVMQRSTLSGVDTEFKHNNMTPFFRGTIKQNVAPRANDALLESFTGNTPNRQSKRGIAPMFRPEETAVTTDVPLIAELSRSRMLTPIARNNILPFDQVRVGPGLGAEGFTADPSRDDLKDRQYVMPPTVDELRVGSNPKAGGTPGVMLAGRRTSQRPLLPTIETRAPQTFKENDCSDLLPVRGGVERDPLWTFPDIKDTNRTATSADYTGGAGAAVSLPTTTYAAGSGRVARDDCSQPAGLRNATAAQGRGEADAFGRDGYATYTNARDVTGTRTRFTNLSTAVKALISPYVDIVRPTRKLFTSVDPNAYGALQTQYPPKQTVYDPSMVARTTIKETTVQDVDVSNVRGAICIAVYDPDDVARTTGRETLPDNDWHLNMRNSALKGTTHDPDDTARTTMKQTTVDSERDGNLDANQFGLGGYQSTPFDAKQTQKEALSDRDRYGGAYRGEGDGYAVTDATAKPTQRQSLSDRDYYGVAGDQSSFNLMSYGAAYNATINGLTEQLLEGRTPTTQGTKVASTDIGDFETRNEGQRYVESKRAANVQRLDQTTTTTDSAIGSTRLLHDDRLDDRLDAAILSSLQTNPFNRSILEN